MNPTLNLHLFLEFVIPPGAVLEGEYLLSQHGVAKLGRDHPESEAMCCINKIQDGGWLHSKKKSQDTGEESVSQSSVQIRVHELTHLVCQNSIYSVSILYSSPQPEMHLCIYSSTSIQIKIVERMTEPVNEICLL